MGAGAISESRLAQWMEEVNADGRKHPASYCVLAPTG